MPLPSREVVLQLASAVKRAAIRKAIQLDRLPTLKAMLAADYRTKIYEAARAYWKEGSRGNFLTRMNATIKFGLNDAWNLGAADCGVEPDEFEQEDKDQIAAIIDEEKSYVAGLLDFLDTLANNPQAKLSDADYRLDMWCLRFEDVHDQARVWFGNGKQKLTWVLGPTKEHCHTGGRPGGVGCANLAGIVAYASEWAQVPDLHPNSSVLSCSGLNCECRLEPTTKRRSPRALARLLAMQEAAHS